MRANVRAKLLRHPNRLRDVRELGQLLERVLAVGAHVRTERVQHIQLLCREVVVLAEQLELILELLAQTHQGLDLVLAGDRRLDSRLQRRKGLLPIADGTRRQLFQFGAGVALGFPFS
ncbi:hypothetical protein D3C87_1334620 [compost metagenome]